MTQLLTTPPRDEALTVVVHQHAAPAAPAVRRRRRGVAAIALACGGAALVGAGAFSSWDTTASVSSGSLSAASGTATLLDANGGTFTTGVSNLLPGDFFYRYVDVRNDGTSANTFTGTVAATGDLAGQVAVDAVTCSLPWIGNICAGVTSTSLGSGTPATGAPVAITHGTIATGTAAAQHVRYKFTFSNAAPSTLMGKSGSLTIAVSNTLVGGTDRTAG